MKRCDTSEGNPTLDIALPELMNFDDLKQLAAPNEESSYIFRQF